MFMTRQTPCLCVFVHLIHLGTPQQFHTGWPGHTWMPGLLLLLQRKSSQLRSTYDVVESTPTNEVFLPHSAGE